MKKLLQRLIALSSIFLYSLAFASSSQYALIIDAGSTGSRLHLFEYHQEKNLPLIHEIYTDRTQPGLSSFENHPENAGASLKKLLDGANRELELRRLDPQKVPLRILGTAGMRLLSEDKQTAIYASVSHYLKSNYAYPLETIATIPGKLEGLYGWLDINYLLKSFENGNASTKGSIDMGGASTQIVFSTEDKSRAEDEVSLKINGKTYKVFTKSFLKMGLVEALLAINAKPLATRCYPKAYAFNEQVGEFNYPTCSTLYLQLLDEKQVAEQIPRHNKMAFVAYSGTYYTAHFFGVDSTPSKLKWEESIERVCNKSWDELKQDYPSVPETMLGKACASGVYLSQLLYKSYQLDDQELTVTQKINQQEIDWALGALFYDLVKT